MPTKTIFRDNPVTECREAWQNGQRVCDWSRRQIDSMNAEAPQSVPKWGYYPSNAPVAPGKRRAITRAAAEIGKMKGER